MKNILILGVLFLLFSCSQIEENNTINVVEKNDKIVVVEVDGNNKNKVDENIVYNNNLLIEEYLEKEKKAFLNSDINYCEKKDKSEKYKEECKLRIVFDFNNTKGCDILEGDYLYKKCLKIEESVERYKKINQDKIYFDKYYR